MLPAAPDLSHATMVETKLEDLPEAVKEGGERGPRAEDTGTATATESDPEKAALGDDVGTPPAGTCWAAVPVSWWETCGVFFVWRRGG